MSDMYAIKTTTLTALGDAVREKSGKLTRPIEYTTTTLEWNDISNPMNTVQFFNPEYLGGLIVFDQVKYKLIEVENLTNIEGQTNISGDFTFDENNEYINPEPLARNNTNLTIRGNAIDVFSPYKCVVEITPYYKGEVVPMADEVTTNTMTPLKMVEEINNITPGPTAEELVFTGDCSYRFANSGWNWVINKYGNLITTKDITKADNMFYNSVISHIPFDLNFKRLGTGTYDYHNCNNLFYNCVKLTSIPKITGLRPYALDGPFNNCAVIREIPLESVEDIDWGYIDSQTSKYNGTRASTFANCSCLRSFPMEFLNHGNPVANYSYSIYYSLFNACYALDEVVNLPIPHSKATWTSNAFSNTFEKCWRLKNITFALQEDGTPYIANGWKSQTISLNNVGWATSTSLITSPDIYQKQVKDDATYQALKDDPDWFTYNVAYSRYNHDSAVATINTLPDVSASGGTNTIKFKGEAGSATDGGAINTLTEEEIAVATAKGWTVSFV